MTTATRNAGTSGTFLNSRAVGIAGILAGVGLAFEFVFFSISGFGQATFNNPATAMTFLRDHGSFVRIAVLFGAFGIVVTLIFVAGLADKLKGRTPTLAAAILLFGIVGNVGDGLVALSFWTGIPTYVSLSADNLSAAESSWPAFATLSSGYQAFGNLFLGLSVLATGWAILSRRQLPLALGVIATLAGLAALISALASDGPLGFFGFATSILMVIIFRIWTGIALLRGSSAGSESVGTPGSATQSVAHSTS